MAYIITSGITSDSLSITGSETLTVSDGGRANNTTVNSGGGLFVSSGGIVNVTFIEEATLKVHNGGMASQTKLDGTAEKSASMQIEEGGVADVILVNAYSNLYVFAGGKATEVVWTPCIGHVSIEEGADVALYSQYAGVYYGDGHSLLSSAALIESQTVGSGYEMYVFDGGVARQTVVNPRGEVLVNDGGRADSTTLYGGTLVLSSGGVAARTTNRGGTVEVSSGGVLISATATDDGVVRVSSGGTAYNSVVTDSFISVSSGATVSGFTLRGEADFYAGTDAKLTGRMIISDESYVYLEHNAIIDFNLSTLTPGAAVRINNFQLVEGWQSVDYTITISGTQANGTYSLAIGFPEYDGAISVVDTEGEVLTTISVGETKDIGGTECTLKIVDGTLVFKKGKEEEQPDRPPVVDNGSNDWLYVKKTKTLNEDLVNSDPALLSPDAEDVRPDAAEEIAFEENETVFHNYVGADDQYDYRKIRLEKGALLSFSVISTDASKFIIYSLTPGKVTKGVQTYTQKAVQTTTLKKGKETGIYYTASTTPILLEAGDYYIAMQSTAKKNGSAYYNIEVDQDASMFFVKGDNSDDWTDLKEKGDTSALIGDVGAITSESSEILADWVGFGDEIDYKAFTLDTAAIISFSLNASDKTKFTIWKLTSKTNKKGVPTYSLSSVQATTLAKPKDADSYSAVTKSVVLDAGTYYFSMESTNAKKGGDADYTVTLKTPGSFFFTHTEHFDDNWLYDKKLKIVNPDAIDFYVTDISSLSTKTILLDGDEDLYAYVGSVRYRNFAGYGDDTDYAKITLYNDAKLSFTISATDKGKFTIWRLDKKTDKKGNVTYSVKSLQATTLKAEKNSLLYSATTKSLSLAAGEYYISFESTNASKGGIAYYNVELNAAGCSGLPSGEDVAEAVPYPGPDAYSEQSALSGSAGYGADALASAVSAISCVQEDAFWTDSALLA